MATVSTNDAAGGAGSLLQSIVGLAVNGVSRALDGELSKRYPLASFNETATLDATGTVKPASAPSKDSSTLEKTTGALNNPYVIAVGSAVGLTLLVLLGVYVARKS